MSSRLRAGEIAKRHTTEIDSNTIRFSRGVGLGDILMRNTGLFATATENFSQDLRISMRGYGMRSAFGIRGIKIVVDGIPESTPDGQGDVDNIETSIISNINILAGPANGIYSNATGGVIEMSTYNPKKKFEINTTSLLGSFGLIKQSLFIGSKLKNNAVSINLGGINYSGFRDHSQHVNYNVQIKAVSKVSSRVSNQFIFNAFKNPKSYDPGGLLITQVKENPRQARDQNMIFNAGENMAQYKFSNLVTYLINGKHEIFATLFYQNRDFDNKLAFTNGGAVTFNRTIFGSQFGFKTRSIIFNDDFLQIGVDHDNQKDIRKRFNNQRGVNGDLTLDQDESFNATGSYFTYSTRYRNWVMMFNGRYEGIKVILKDNFLKNGDQSGDQYYRPLTGSIRIGNHITPNFYVSGSILKGFETPTLTELINNPDGIGFADISPAITKGFELSSEYKYSGNNIKLSLFDYQSSNELIPYQIVNQQGRVFYRNGGNSSRLGLELVSSNKLTKQVDMNISGSINKFTFNSDPNSNQNNFLTIPGIPQSSLRVALIINSIKNTNYMFDFINNGFIYADQNNEVKIAPQRGLHVHGQRNLLYNNLEIIPSLGGRFMLSQLNYNNILINAVGSRYYEPMSRLSWYLKVSIGWKK